MNSLLRSSTIKSLIVRPGGQRPWLAVQARAKGGVAQSQRRRRFDRDFRLKYNPGTYVEERTVLCTQRHLNYHPGLNTAIEERENCIFSLRAGTMIVTSELVQPDLSHPMAAKHCSDLPGPTFKKFVHVIPKPEAGEFRLIDLV